MKFASILKRESTLGIILHWSGILAVVVLSKADFTTWWPWLTITCVVIAMVTAEIVANRSAISQNDKNLIEEYISPVITKHSLKFLKEQDMGNGFFVSNIEFLDSMKDTTEDVPAFKNKTLQDKWQRLRKSSLDLHCEISKYLLPPGEGGWAMFSDYIKGNPDLRNEITGVMNKSAEDTYEAMKDLRGCINEADD